MSPATTHTSASRRAGSSRRGAARGGFTLAESLVASVVLAMAVVGVAGTLTATYQSMSSSAGTTEAVAMARQLIEEISAKPFAVPATEVDNPGYLDGATNRASYDTIGDYQGYADTSNTIKKLDGASVAAGSGGVFARSVTITAGVRPTGHTAPAADFALIAVSVTKPNGEIIKVSQLVTNATIVQ